MPQPNPPRIRRSPLPALLAALACLALFVVLANQLAASRLVAIDRMFLLAFRQDSAPHDPLGPLWLREAVRDVTALGSYSVLALVVLVACLWLAQGRRWTECLFVLAASGGGIVLLNMLKLELMRARPDLVPPMATTFTPSFPSAHAGASAAVYLAMALLLGRSRTLSRGVKAGFVALALVLMLVVGTSRVYLGLHYPSDVAAGWLVATGWTLLCWAAVIRLGPTVARPGERVV